MRQLAAEASRGHGGYTDAELRAIDDWRSMHGTDWAPQGSYPNTRDQRVLEEFRAAQHRDPYPLPHRFCKEALRRLREQQKRDRDDLEAKKDARTQ